MLAISTTALSHLTDREYLSHLYNKAEPTDEDLESAVRLELLLNNYDALLAQLTSHIEEVASP